MIQVVSNLLSNAIKFTRDSGTIKINIGTRAAPTVDSQKEAVVVISDQGQGIDPEIMPRLFEKFASKSEQGTGLGLYLLKKIVEAHWDTIWAENNKDRKGATFSFSLLTNYENGKVRSS